MKKKYIYILGAAVLVIAAVFLIRGFSGASENSVISSGKSSLYPEIMKVRYSKSFEIEYLDSAKIIRVFTPDEKRTLIFRYLLLPEGKPVPAGYSNYQVVRTPVKTLISLSSIYVGFLDKLDLLDRLVAVDNFEFVVSPKVKELIRENKIAQVGETVNLNVEKVFAMNPGILLTYGNGNPVQDGHQKLIENGIKVASTTSHLENTPLARAEWIKFVAAFFDKEKKANQVFDSLEANYNRLKELASKVKTRPTVFTDALFGGKWYKPGGNSYAARLILDAGGDYLWKDNNSAGSLKLDFEQVYEKAHDADFWINVHYWNKISEIEHTDPRYTKFKAYRTRNVFNNNASVNEFGGNEIWESGIIRCDEILADLIKIFHPELLPGHTLRYYKKLAEN
jgi:iron complex transport system substrate-binding protein